MFAADSVETFADDALVEEFRRARQEAYGALAKEMERVISRINATRRPRGTRAPAVPRLVEVFRGRLSALERIDFFGSAGRDRVVSLMAYLEERARPAMPSGGATSVADVTDGASYGRRLWVTRPRPGVDRMSSAWLIRRFVDPEARFGFAVDRDALPDSNAIPFDMFGVEFTHRGDTVRSRRCAASSASRIRRWPALPRSCMTWTSRTAASAHQTRRPLTPSSKGSNWRRPTTTSCSNEGSRSSNRCSVPSNNRPEQRAHDPWRSLLPLTGRQRGPIRPPVGAGHVERERSASCHRPSRQHGPEFRRRRKSLWGASGSRPAAEPTWPGSAPLDSSCTAATRFAARRSFPCSRASSARARRSSASSWAPPP